MSKFAKSIMLLVLGLTLGCNQGHVSDTSSTEPQKTGETTSQTKADASATSSLQLLFFMNPNGRPCRIQDDKLSTIKEAVESKAKIVYVRTDVPSDREKFYKYGVRSLPMMIVTDNAGNEKHRFTPGIQSESAILDVLRGL